MVFHVYYADCRRSGENIMSKSLITFIAIVFGEIATDKEDLRKLVYQAKKDNRIMDVGNLQPGTLVIVKVEEARNQ